jgi:hypothetical protein
VPPAISRTENSDLRDAKLMRAVCLVKENLLEKFVDEMRGRAAGDH